MCLFFIFQCGIKYEILKMSNLKIWAKALHWVLELHICGSRYGQQRAAVPEVLQRNVKDLSLAMGQAKNRSR